MKHIIVLILVISALLIGCSNEVPPPPALPQDNTEQVNQPTDAGAEESQQQNTDIPMPPALPEE